MWPPANSISPKDKWRPRQTCLVRDGQAARGPERPRSRGPPRGARRFSGAPLGEGGDAGRKIRGQGGGEREIHVLSSGTSEVEVATRDAAAGVA